jgi:predicted neuraminidase
MLSIAAIAHTGPDIANIFPPQEKHVHSSSIVECPNGDLLAVWFHGSGVRRSIDVKIQGARRKAGASEWGPVFTYSDTPDLPDCNPVLFVDQQQRLWLFWMVVHMNRWEQSILKYRRSSNFVGEGQPVWDWQDIILLKPGESFADDLKNGFKDLGYQQHMWAEHAHAYNDLLVAAAADPVKRDIGWMTRTNPLTLKSGRIVLPLYSDGYNVSLMATSDDGGTTWQTSKPIVGLGNIQPAVAERRDGTLVAWHRDNGDAPKRISRATSRDGGTSWTTATDIEIPNPGSSVAVRALSSGSWILVANDTERGRHRIVVFRSTDEGKTWPRMQILEDSPSGECSYGYPSALEDHEGGLHITYSYKGPEGAAIRHVELDAQQIGQNP